MNFNPGGLKQKAQSNPPSVSREITSSFGASETLGDEEFTNLEGTFTPNWLQGIPSCEFSAVPCSPGTAARRSSAAAYGSPANARRLHKIQTFPCSRKSGAECLGRNQGEEKGSVRTGKKRYEPVEAYCTWLWKLSFSVIPMELSSLYLYHYKQLTKYRIKFDIPHITEIGVQQERHLQHKLAQPEAMVKSQSPPKETGMAK